MICPLGLKDGWAGGDYFITAAVSSILLYTRDGSSQARLESSASGARNVENRAGQKLDKYIQKTFWQFSGLENLSSQY